MTQEEKNLSDYRQSVEDSVLRALYQFKDYPNFTSIKVRSLSSIMDKAEVENRLRSALLTWFEDNSVIMITGERGGTKFKFTASLIDINKIAKKAADYLVSKFPKPAMPVKRKIQIPLPKRRFYSVGEKVYFLEGSSIKCGIVLAQEITNRMAPEFYKELEEGRFQMHYKITNSLGEIFNADIVASDYDQLIELIRVKFKALSE